jgi:hypothetical protein
MKPTPCSCLISRPASMPLIRPYFPDRRWPKIGSVESRILDYWLSQEPPRFAEIDKVLAWASRHPRLTLVLATGHPERLAAYCEHALDVDGAYWADLRARTMCFPLRNVQFEPTIEQSLEIADPTFAYVLTFSETQAMVERQQAAIKANRQRGPVRA